MKKEVRHTRIIPDYLYFELEKSRMARERAMMILNKSFIFYFAYLIVGVVGFLNDYVTPTFLNILVLMGLLVLIVGTVPFVKTMVGEEKTIDNILVELRGKK